MLKLGNDQVRRRIRVSFDYDRYDGIGEMPMPGTTFLGIYAQRKTKVLQCSRLRLQSQASL